MREKQTNRERKKKLTLWGLWSPSTSDGMLWHLHHMNENEGSHVSGGLVICLPASCKTWNDMSKVASLSSMWLALAAIVVVLSTIFQVFLSDSDNSKISISTPKLIFNILFNFCDKTLVAYDDFVCQKFCIWM
jgi:hypothetical protein